MEHYSCTTSLELPWGYLPIWRCVCWGTSNNKQCCEKRIEMELETSKIKKQKKNNKQKKSPVYIYGYSCGINDIAFHYLMFVVPFIIIYNSSLSYNNAHQSAIEDVCFILWTWYSEWTGPTALSVGFWTLSCWGICSHSDTRPFCCRQRHQLKALNERLFSVRWPFCSRKMSCS